MLIRSRCSHSFDSVKSLSNVLRDVEDTLPHRDLSPRQEAELREIVQGCCDVLKQLEEMLDNYQELESTGSKSSINRSRRIWKRLRWDQKEVDIMRSRIISSITLLDTFLGRITRYPTLSF